MPSEDRPRAQALTDESIDMLLQLAEDLHTRHRPHVGVTLSQCAALNCQRVVALVAALREAAAPNVTLCTCVVITGGHRAPLDMTKPCPVHPPMRSLSLDQTEVLRKLVAKWRLHGDPRAWKCASELEALLSTAVPEPPVPQKEQTELSVCRACGHYQYCHIEGRCDGWMAGGVYSLHDKCQCSEFTAAGAREEQAEKVCQTFSESDSDPSICGHCGGWPNDHVVSVAAGAREEPADEQQASVEVDSIAAVGEGSAGLQRENEPSSGVRHSGPSESRQSTQSGITSDGHGKQASASAEGLAGGADHLPKRDVPALVEALRIRALALTGQEWERNATRDMMKEAAQQLEDDQATLTALRGELAQAQTSDYQTRKHAQDVKDEARWLRDGIECEIERWHERTPVIPSVDPIGWVPISVLLRLLRQPGQPRPRAISEVDNSEKAEALLPTTLLHGPYASVHDLRDRWVKDAPYGTPGRAEILMLSEKLLGEVETPP